MGKQKSYHEEMIERYIYQVKKHLPSSNKDIEEEIKSLIYEMLEARSKAAEPSKQEMDAVLTELGDPATLAENYRGKSRYLIGPGLFPTYLMLLKIVLSSVLLAMTVVTVLELITGERQVWYVYIGNWFSHIWNGLLGAFAWVTGIFALLEYKGVSTGELSSAWEVSSLPPVPRNETKIPISESVVGIIFHIFLLILFTSAPRLFGIYLVKDGNLTAYPVFDLIVLEDILPLFLIGIGLGILKNIYALIERQYNIRYAVFDVTCSLSEMLLAVIIFTAYPIWNENFPGFFGDISAVNNLWNIITSNFATCLIIIYLAGIGITLYKTFKHRLK